MEISTPAFQRWVMFNPAIHCIVMFSPAIHCRGYGIPPLSGVSTPAIGTETPTPALKHRLCMGLKPLADGSFPDPALKCRAKHKRR